MWLTRFWTAKEAVGKAEGTGLAGRPRQFVVTAADGTSLTVTAPGCHVRYVQTRVVAAGSGDDCVVAWTAPGGSEGPDGDDPAEAGVGVTNPDVLSF